MFGAILTALKVVVTAYSAYTAVKGLQEGNIMQAIVGGIGAYAGFQSLQGAYGAQVGNSTGELTGEVLAVDTAADVATQAADTVSGGFVDVVSEPLNLAEGAAMQASTEALAPVLESSISQGANMAPMGAASTSVPGVNAGLLSPLKANADLLKGSGLLQNPQAEALQSGANANLKPSEEPSFMDQLSEGYDDIKGLLGDNQQLLGYGLQYMGGQQQQDFLEDQLKKREEEKERLRGYAATAPTFKYSYGV